MNKSDKFALNSYRRLSIDLFFAILLVGIVIGCSTTPETREITESNYVVFKNPDLSLKVSDDLEYKGKQNERNTDERGVGAKREVWVWKSIDDRKGFYILIDTATTTGVEYTGSINSLFHRQHEYYQSFPKTVQRGGVGWYVDIVHHNGFNRVIYGKNSGIKKRVYLFYEERGPGNEDWKALLERAESAVAFYQE